jgi:Zn finger protein HypA/HybF involved in hydrogenase expression
LEPTPEKSEFAEIALANAKIKLLRQPTGAISLQVKGLGGVSLIQIGVALDGARLEYWPMHGVNMNPKPEARMVPVMLVSDREQFFGRTCPNCNAYFRTRHVAEALLCPYCSTRAPLIRFTTENQLRFIDEVRQKWVDGFKGNDLEEIDLDAITKELPDNRPRWSYSEELQQNRFTCGECDNRFDILGEYGCCPVCGKRNSLQVVMSYLNAAQAQFESASASIAGREDRQIEWGKMIKCVSDFEAMARDIQNQLARLPLTPTRRKEVEQISFQQILRAEELMRGFFGIELLKGVTDTDREFLNKMFNRRHILTHNAGRVDQEYLDRTSDSSVRLNQKVVVRSREIARLIPLLKTAAVNLFQGYESIASQ